MAEDDQDPVRRAARMAARVVGAGGAFRMGEALLGEAKMPAPVVPDDLWTTKPMQATADGLISCNGCRRGVAFADLTMDQDGYFCAGCMRAKAQARALLEPERPVLDPETASIRSKSWITTAVIAAIVVVSFVLFAVYK